MTRPAGDAGAAGRLAALHALAFLVAGCAAGVLLSALLVAPGAGDALAPLTYGRWAPVHQDVLLYGWGALPLVALLLHAFRAGDEAPRLAAASVHAWSALVLAQAACSLLGGASGKAFLGWTGRLGILAIVLMSALTAALAVALLRQAGRSPRPAGLGARALLLLVLAPVPFVIAWAARPGVRPPINPDSGGPTGVSLMGSVLGMAALLLLTPVLLGLAPKTRAPLRRPVAILAVHAAAFLALEILAGGDRSHREAIQITALASVAIWVPLLARALRAFAWPPEAAPWLRASAAWGALLAASGIAAFVPGVLERWKFSHALVAHAHVALAGFVTAWSLVVLATLAGGRLRAALGGIRAARTWNGALAAHVLALAGLAAIEQSSPAGLLPRGGGIPAAAALMALRLAAGVASLGVAAGWCAAAWRDLAGAGTGAVIARGAAPSGIAA